LRYLPLLLLASVGVASATPAPTGATPAAPVHLLFGESYPLEVHVSFPAALFHWLDSLAGLDGPGMTGGKTQSAHRQHFVRRLGPPGSLDQQNLQRFAEIRLRDITERDDDRIALALVFLEAPDLDAALAQVEGLIDPEDARALAETMAYFAPRYAEIWQGGEVPRRFLDKVLRSPRRDRLAALLARVQAFYGIESIEPPLPRLVLVPVNSGFGTHAQALGRNLLVEVRPHEGLAEEVAPIVHENAHFLFYRMEDERMERLRRVAESAGPHGADAWMMLLEALPTAIAQGVAWKQLGPSGWSLERSWYHVDAVDEYAKRLYPRVRNALKVGGRFDEAFVEQAVARHPEAGDAPPVTRRSP
jgi:hypothetical protein